MTGEQTHETGREGAMRAKRWLDATTRADVAWINPSAAQKLTYAWPYGGQSFSFDLGGVLRGGKYDGNEFYVEVKRYRKASDQAQHYLDYLARCYCAYQLMPNRFDHFMWITWSPFATSDWPKLLTKEHLVSGLKKNASRVFGITDGSDISSHIEVDLCEEVADRLWIIVLSDKQEDLVIEPEHLALVYAARAHKVVQ
jgi:hypothetical protein